MKLTPFFIWDSNWILKDYSNEFIHPWFYLDVHNLPSPLKVFYYGLCVQMFVTYDIFRCFSVLRYQTIYVVIEARGVVLALLFDSLDQIW